MKKLSKTACFLALLFAWLLVSSACTPSPDVLASFEESSVLVALWLEKNSQGEYFLVVKFTPTEADDHLYSKDIPVDGINGLGRPTFFTLTAESSLQPAGELQSDQNLLEQPVRADLPALRVYPAGPVTLRLPVRLPTGKTSWNDEIAITYMACQGNRCKRPVVGRVIPFQIDIGK